MRRMTGEDLEKLSLALMHRAPHEAAELLAAQSDEDALAAMDAVNPLIVQQLLRELDDHRRCELLAAAPVEKAHQWMKNQEYPEDSVGWLMEPPVAVFRPTMTVRETIEGLRRLTKKAFITYGYVTDEKNQLIGVLVMRDLMLASPDQLVSEVMLTDPFWLEPQMALTDAMKSTLNRHFPVYPVCDEHGHLVGLVRGQSLFEARAIELSAQPGSMVGVNEDERLSTALKRSFWMRHPWLQFNLMTAFVAAAIISLFQRTLDSMTIIAVFLPVLAGQSGNTGCQTLAITLRGLTLGDMRHGQELGLILKEAFLGFVNGLLVGVVAGLGMYVYASMKHSDHAPMLGFTVLLAMTLSCIISGLAGVTIPLILRKLSFDPATASSIFLTTVTDCVSMGTFLALATWLVKV